MMNYSANLYRNFSKEEHSEMGISPDRWHGSESNLQGVVDCLKARVLVGTQQSFWDGTLEVKWEDGRTEVVEVAV